MCVVTRRNDSKCNFRYWTDRKRLNVHGTEKCHFGNVAQNSENDAPIRLPPHLSPAAAVTAATDDDAIGLHDFISHGTHYSRERRLYDALLSVHGCQCQACLISANCYKNIGQRGPSTTNRPTLHVSDRTVLLLYRFGMALCAFSMIWELVTVYMESPDRNDAAVSVMKSKKTILWQLLHSTVWDPCASVWTW